MPKISTQRLLARRRGIVLAATRCLQRKGLENTGMRDVFRAANLSPGAVYRYFAGKEELLAAVAAESPSIAEAALASTETVGDPVARLRALLEAAAEGGLPARLQVELQAAALGSPAIAAALGERRTASHRALAKALQGPGGAPPREAVDLVLATCEGLARSRLLDPEAEAAAQAAAAERLLAPLLDRA
jgi:AcrR family transcriptional regulator